MSVFGPYYLGAHLSLSCLDLIVAFMTALCCALWNYIPDAPISTIPQNLRLSLEFMRASVELYEVSNSCGRQSSKLMPAPSLW